MDRNEITTEQLQEDNIIIFSLNKKIFELTALTTEVYTAEKLENIFSVECLNQQNQFRTPFITVVGKNYAGLNKSLTTAYEFIRNNLETYSDNNFPFAMGFDKLANTGKEEEIQKALDDIVAIIKKLDIDITHMEYKKDELKESNYKMLFDKFEFGLNKNSISATEINSFHKDIYGNEVRFNFKEESAGTQRIACLLGIILSTLRKGNVLIIDELDKSLHTYLFAEIIRMFKDKRYNKTNAQLIFTTHNTDIMEQDMMRISEIGLVNKTLNKGTTFNRISDFEGIRNIINFRKQYLEGSFSAIPYPYI